MPIVLVAAALLALAVAITFWVFFIPTRGISMARRRYGVSPSPNALTRLTDRSLVSIESVVRSRGRLEAMVHSLDLAGIRRSVPEFILLVGASTIAGAAIGLVLGGPIAAILIGVMIVLGSIVAVSFRAGRRRDDFADQLDDVVQLLGSNLRAGHSVLQAIDSVAQEIEDPGASELARVVNQVRVGRDLGEALDEASERMQSDDFRWIAQAIAIHRQVGGNLAQVMDTVGETIRERNQIRRQVAALAAEGKLSAYVLVALPIGVVLMFQFLNPAYLAPLTESILGYVLIVIAFLLLVGGSFWLSRLVKVKF